MNQNILKETVSRLVASPKGILAIDESINTCNKRFEKLGIPQTDEKRQEYRELLVTAPMIENYVSGYITFDETIRQSTKDGRKFSDVLKGKGVDVGIKVDTGLKEIEGCEGEKFTDGLEGLDARLKEYREMGATFAKWRAVYNITDKTPSEACMQVNAKSLARYALLCQENDIVPIVEPEVLYEGSHSIEECYEVTAKNFKILFAELSQTGVYVEGIILKTSMVLAGKDAVEKSTTEQVAEMTLRCLKENVPSNIGGIVFLSGGISDKEATLNLNQMHKMGTLPWPLSFSYGRAIQNEALKAWASNPADLSSAQALLVKAAEANSLASVGKYE